MIVWMSSFHARWWNTSVWVHLAKMNRIHRGLTVELEYEIINAFTKSMVLRSLPPSYRGFVESFVKGNEAVNFHQLLGRIKIHEVEPVQGEIIDLDGIFDIQYYKCFINTYAVLSI
jgi:hypothetical protein